MTVPAKPTENVPCATTTCNNMLTVLVDGRGLALCGDCREAIWGDEDPHYADDLCAHKVTVNRVCKDCGEPQ